jgi:hypothetical protein
VERNVVAEVRVLLEFRIQGVDLAYSLLIL